ncbi:hypothetical protein [Streptosporangium sp. NPDC001681]|uniref:hypothetical protein n=1 Tax=Streptosporangium sp. NPDC001681 TaxID=3154395 RepID=UPI0033184702
MSRPDDLPPHHRRHLEELIPACPHLTALASRVREFAAILTQRRGHDLDDWISTVRADDLLALHSFALGLEKDQQAVIAGLTLPYGNGPMEGTQHQGQAAETSDVRPSRLRPAAAADPAFLSTHCHHRIRARVESA